MVIRKMMSKMISPAILSHDPYLLYFSWYETHYPPWAGSQGGMMSLLGLLKRHTLEPPAEVIQAACDLFGLSPQNITSIQAERLSALSPFLWVITLNESARAIVVYMPGASEQLVAAPWFEE